MSAARGGASNAAESEEEEDDELLDEDRDDDDDDEEEEEDEDEEQEQEDQDSEEEEEEEENPSDNESYVANEDEADEEDDDDSGSSEEDDEEGGGSGADDSDLEEDLLAARERILAEKEKAKVQRRAAKRKAKRAKQAKLRKLKKLREEIKNIPELDNLDVGDEDDADARGRAGAAARGIPRNPAANATSRKKRVRAAPAGAALRPAVKKKRKMSAKTKKREGVAAPDAPSASLGAGQAQLIVPKSGWKAIHPLVEDFVESALRGVCPVLLSLPKVERMQSKEKERLLRYLNECCNRIMDEVPQLTVPPTVAVGANDFPDLSRRIQVLKQENEKKDAQIEAVLDQLDDYDQKFKALLKEHKKISDRLGALPAAPPRADAMPSFLEPFRQREAPPSGAPTAKPARTSEGAAGDDRAAWANTFQTIVGL